MGIFSRRRAEREQSIASPPEPEEAHGRRFRSVPVRAVQLGVEGELVYDRLAARPRMLSFGAAEVLHACRTFDTPESHARRFARRGGAGMDGMGAFGEGLSELIDAGLIITHDDAIERIASHRREAQAPAISALGVVTRDRPAMLLRCLRSFAASVSRYGHETELVVLDDSAEPTARGRCRETLGALRRELGLPLAYAGREEKQAFASALCEAGDFSADLIDFVLFDPCGCGYSTGANRNALALHANGEACLSVDDDTVAEFAAAPDRSSEAVLSSAHDPTAFWWFAERDAVLANADWRDIDILSEHARFLGRGLGQCLDPSTRVDLDPAGDDLLVHALAGRGEVVATATGVAGDSGMGSPGYYMLLRGAQRQRIAGENALYEQLRLTREVFRAAPLSTLSAGMYFMSTHFALDGRELLPPFFPVLRNSDGIFGRTLRQIRPDGLIAHLPFGVRHEPPDARAFDESALWNWCGAPRAGDIVMVCILSATLTGREPAARLRELGQYLVALGDLPPQEFDETVRMMVWERRAADLQYCESLLAHYDESPARWAEDLGLAAERIRESFMQPDFLMPRDLRPIEGVDAATLTRELVGRYGRLLVAWPDINAAARSLRAAGKRLAQPL